MMSIDLLANNLAFSSEPTDIEGNQLSPHSAYFFIAKKWEELIGEPHGIVAEKLYTTEEMHEGIH